MEKYRHVLSEQCLKMQLNGATMDYCLELFDGYMKDMHTFPMHHIKAIILGALFYACKHGGAPRTPAELADQTHTKLREVRQGMKLVSKRCSMIMTSDVQKTSQNLVDRYCDELGLDMPFISKAREVDDKIRQYVEGKHSNTVAATDIALTFEWFYPPEFAILSPPSFFFLAHVSLTRTRACIAMRGFAPTDNGGTRQGLRSWLD